LRAPRRAGRVQRLLASRRALDKRDRHPLRAKLARRQQQVRDLAAAATQALVKASKTCKALRRSDPATFRQKYGSRPNAFAKCVSAQAKRK
jgi:hypothetical protein